MGKHLDAKTVIDIAGEDTPVYTDACRYVREERDTLLAKTDTWGLADYPATAEQTAYRQSLRDITDQAGFPANITWPTKP